MEFKSLILIPLLATVVGCTCNPKIVEVKVPVPVIAKINKPHKPLLESANITPTDSPDVRVKAMEIDHLQLMKLIENYDLIIDTYNNFKVTQ